MNSLISDSRKLTITISSSSSSSSSCCCCSSSSSSTSSKKSTYLSDKCTCMVELPPFKGISVILRQQEGDNIGCFTIYGFC